MSPRKKSRCERFDVSQREHSIALDRTDFLLDQTHRPLRDLIANAYLQGVIDAAETMADSSTPIEKGGARS